MLLQKRMISLIYLAAFVGTFRTTSCRSSTSVNFGDLDPDNREARSNPLYPVVGVDVIVTKGQPANTCACVTAANCAYQSPGTAGPRETLLVRANNTNGINFPGEIPNTARIINNLPSQNTCPSDLIYCCSIITQTTPQPSPQPAPNTCGLRTTFSTGNIVSYGQADFGEYPWQSVILTSSNDFIASAVLVSDNTIISVAHRIEKYSSKGVAMKVRLGDWNLGDENEPFKYSEVGIKEIILHPEYNCNSLENDIAIIKLEKAVGTSTEFPHINSACLPESGASFDGQRCWVSGYGHTSYPDGRPSLQLREVDVPIINTLDCQNNLRGPILGYGFLLNPNSFICAGGEPGKDACIGDGGSGLVCQGSDKRFRVAGLVSWGIGCASSKIPGVYVNVANYVNWIRKYL